MQDRTALALGVELRRRVPYMLLFSQLSCLKACKASSQNHTCLCFPCPPLQQVLNESGPRAQGRAPSPPLRVVPLFETLSDLEASRSVMQSLYR